MDEKQTTGGGPHGFDQVLVALQRGGSARREGWSGTWLEAVGRDLFISWRDRNGGQHSVSWVPTLDALTAQDWHILD